LKRVAPKSPALGSFQGMAASETLDTGIVALGLGMISIALFFSAPFASSYGSAISGYDLMTGYVNIVKVGPTPLFLFFMVGAVVLILLGLYGALTGGRMSSSDRKIFHAAIALSGLIMMLVCVVELFILLMGGPSIIGFPPRLQYGYGYLVPEPDWGMIAGAGIGWVIAAVGA
jgi:hypothetical protein